MSIIPYEKSFASHEKSKYWSSKNGDITPRNVYMYSNKKFRFECNVCNHSFENTICNITNGNNWCPYCSNNKLCDDELCKICFEKSFASHEKSKYWSDINKNVKPRDLFKKSNKKFFLNCETCFHSFEISLSNLSGNGRWCSYCSNKKLCDIETCKICFEKSFASHEKSKYWSVMNKDITPRNIFKSSNKKCFFNCEKCEHNFEVVLNNVTTNEQWCQYCSNRKLCNNEKCILCFNNSFASHEKSKYWSDINKNVKPRNVFKSSSEMYFFNCDICNVIFKTSLNRITQNCWCPFCKNKTELKLYNFLLPIYKNVITQLREKWCKNKKKLPFDFCLPDEKIIIELDGPQHFRQISTWNSPEQQFENDKYKEKCANENGYSTIRILQEDVYNDKYDWCKELCETIENVKKLQKITNIYLCKNEEYKNYD